MRQHRSRVRVIDPIGQRSREIVRDACLLEDVAIAPKARVPAKERAIGRQPSEPDRVLIF